MSVATRVRTIGHAARDATVRGLTVVLGSDAEPVRTLRAGGLVAVLALFLWAGALVCIVFPPVMRVVGAVAILASIGLMLRLLGYSRGRGVLGTVLAGLLLLIAMIGSISAAQPTRAELAGWAGSDVEAFGQITSKIEHRPDGSAAFDVEVMVYPIEPWAPPSAPARLFLRDGDEARGLEMGATITVRGDARAGRPAERAAVALFADDVEILADSPMPLAIAGALRHGLVEASAALPSPGGELVPGLAVGDTSRVSAELDSAMKRASLSHLTAVSGANCAIVVGAAFALAGLCRLRRPARVAIALTALAGFVLLVTPEPSVVRAAVMAVIALIALALDRPGAGVGVLGGAVIVLLLVDPWLAGSLGFALSAAATAALLVLAGPLARGLARWMPSPLALALAVPLAAQVACGPLLILVDPAVALYGVPANLLAAPAAPAATILGMLACLLHAVPGIGAVLLWMAYVPAAWISGIAGLIAEAPAARLEWSAGFGGALSLVALGAVVVLAVAGPRRGPWRMAQRAAMGALAVVIGVAAGTVTLAGAAAPLTLPADAALVQCDVGQGDALVLRSHGEVMLVDTGPDSRALEDCLRKTGVGRVDVLVLTHFDLDHVGGVDAVVGRVGLVLHGPVADPEEQRMLDDLKRAGADLRPTAGGTTGVFGSVRWRALWPVAGGGGFESGNESSVVLDIRETTVGGTMPHALLLGDLGASAQAALVAGGTIRPPYDVVKVAHHGSADQDPALYRTVAAQIALIGVGTGNDYGHPRDEILDVLEDAGALVRRSDQDGVVAITRRPDDLRIWAESADQAG